MSRSVSMDQYQPDRKARFKSLLDEFIAEEKSTLSGQSDEGKDVELQYRLDHFMHKLHDRVEQMLQQPEAAVHSDCEQTRSSDSEDTISHEMLDDDSELLPASELLYLDESLHSSDVDVEADAAIAPYDIEGEFSVYEINKLNVDAVKQQGPLSGRAVQAGSAVVVSMLLLWLLWPASQSEVVQPIKQQKVVATEIAPVTETVVQADQSPAEIVAVAQPAAVEREKLTVLISFGNVRDKPSAKGEVLFQLKQGDVVRELDRKWGWYQIELTDGRRGWAYQSLFSAADVKAERETEAPVIPDQAGEVVTEPESGL